MSGCRSRIICQVFLGSEVSALRAARMEPSARAWVEAWCLVESKALRTSSDSAGGRIIRKGEAMGEEKRQRKFLGQLYRDFEDWKLAHQQFEGGTIRNGNLTTGHPPIALHHLCSLNGFI